MIIEQAIECNEISKLGKEYPYVRPGKCPRCGSIKIWGHGYVRRYFDGYAEILCLKRWICADCGCVISIRPKNYFRRHHATTQKILDCIKHRLNHGCWIRGPALSRQKQGHWLRALRKNILILLGFDYKGNILEGFKQLISNNQCPINRLTQSKASA